MGLTRPLKTLYVQVLIGIALGIVVGALWPDVGVALKPLGDGFIKLVKLVIAPVIFLTVAGNAASKSFEENGRYNLTLTSPTFSLCSRRACTVSSAVSQPDPIITMTRSASFAPV